MRERRRGRRVGQVVRRDIDGLDGGDRAGLRGGDPFLQRAHLLGEIRLVPDGGRHASEQRRHFRAGQGVAIDVVDEEQHVAAFVAELLGEREGR